MASTELRTLLLTTVVLLPLALGAGYLGSRMGTGDDTADPEPLAVAPASGGAGLKFLDELDRRLQTQEEYRQRDEQRWQAAMDQINALSTRVDALERRGPAASPETGPASTDGESAEPEEIPGAATAEKSIQEQMAEQYADTTHKGLLHRFKLLADGTGEGEAGRKSNAYVYAKRAQTRFTDTDLDIEALNAIYLGHMERAAREVGPLVTHGLDGADIATVRERYTGLLADTDGKVAALLSGTELETWNRERSAYRKMVDEILASYEDKR